MDGQLKDWVRTHATFTKSTFSEGGSCVEVARVDVIGVRNSKDPDGPLLLLTRSGWDAFASGIVAGVFGRIH